MSDHLITESSCAAVVKAARRGPIYEDVRLLDGDKGVDEDGVHAYAPSSDETAL
jgi:hypothetical protein